MGADLTSLLGPVGIGVNVATGLLGLLGSGAANKRNERLLQKQQNFLDKEYLPDMNRRYLDTEEAQSFISSMRDRLNENNQKVNQMAAVTGGTDEAVTAAKEANTRSYADYLNRLSGMGSRFKQGIKDRYMQGKNQLFGMAYGANQGASQSGSNVFSNAMNSVGNLAMMPLLGKDKMSGLSDTFSGDSNDLLKQELLKQ